jgi:hypothetical protein
MFAVGAVMFGRRKLRPHGARRAISCPLGTSADAGGAKVQATATTVKQFAGWTISDDGDHLLLKFIDRHRAARFLAIPRDQARI